MPAAVAGGEFERLHDTYVHGTHLRVRGVHRPDGEWITTKLGQKYTYRGESQYHGVVMVRIVDGVIASWREHQVRSQLPWEQFVDENRF